MILVQLILMFSVFRTELKIALLHVASSYGMFCAIWYDLYNLKNVKNTHGGVLLLVKLQAFSLQLY